jgi:NAD(P)-dependent dehydrogenase (short-subunit alcohol dehydrogenase family)
MTSPDKISLVTGAGSGIGKRTALALSKEGYVVVLAGRTAAKLDSVAAEIVCGGGKALAATTDVSDAASVRNLFATIEREFARLDLLFNNAGINAPPVPIDELPVDEWQAVVNVNLTGAFLCLREAFALMKRQRPQGGRIINNGSISAHLPRPHSAPYTATKHAITGLTKSAALDGRKFDIACGQIDIGNAATDLTKRMHHGVLQADGSTAVEPTIDADHVARAVVYMASLPLDANVLFLTVMATKMPLVGRG